ncbi:hypothetical protein LM1A4_046 [Leuconostoc phage 1-A4]|uniref:Uncharacterized protein n=1 Tax=Leuconostoc phage 1-A4 TaxID=745088 RepID=D4N4L9_9CAUD|nr:hypothetical protein LM1A4_046 [Leuconostoc phage 1-A4]ADD71769.1 hypothetical protein LM1A4_046 [Leuconostoc phage 1-A4]
MRETKQKSRVVERKHHILILYLLTYAVLLKLNNNKRLDI